MTINYTHPDVLTIGVQEGWADPETDPARIDWAPRQARAVIRFFLIGGRPVNPCESTGIRYGRNEFGHWGEALMADALVTAVVGGIRYLLMVERRDGHGWAVPGGHVEDLETGERETGPEAAARELEEETGLILSPLGGIAGEPRYVPDPRASDEAWAVTIPVRFDLGVLTECPPVTGGDDARRAAWVACGSYPVLVQSLSAYLDGEVFRAHVGMLSEFLGTGQDR